MSNSTEIWDDLHLQIARLIHENKQLKQDKQALTNELMNLKLKMKQEDARRKNDYSRLISEGR